MASSSDTPVRVKRVYRASNPEDDEALMHLLQEVLDNNSDDDLDFTEEAENVSSASSSASSDCEDNNELSPTVTPVANRLAGEDGWCAVGENDVKPAEHNFNKNSGPKVNLSHDAIPYDYFSLITFLQTGKLK